jgi:molecular chaperone GrpE
MSDRQEPDNEIRELTEASDVEDTASLKKELAELRDKADSYLAGWQRAQADFANFKRWSGEEREEARRLANAALVLSLLPVLDDFQRALDAVPEECAELGWADGIRLIERKLQTALESHGLSEIKALGKHFDPNFHEAVMQGKGKEGVVVGETEKGYRLNDRVIRPSKVIVGNGEEEI